MKRLLTILVILTIIGCKKDIIQPTPIVQIKTDSPTILPFVKIKTEVSTINSGTSFYNTLDKDYQNWNKFSTLVPVGEH